MAISKATDDELVCDIRSLQESMLYYEAELLARGKARDLTMVVERVLEVMYPITREPDGTPAGDHQRRFASDIVNIVVASCARSAAYTEQEGVAAPKPQLHTLAKVTNSLGEVFHAGARVDRDDFHRNDGLVVEVSTLSGSKRSVCVSWPDMPADTGEWCDPEVLHRAVDEIPEEEFVVGRHVGLTNGRAGGVIVAVDFALEREDLTIRVRWPGQTTASAEWYRPTELRFIDDDTVQHPEGKL